MKRRLVRYRPRYAWFIPSVYWVCVALLRLLLSVFTRWHVEGREHIPSAGALVVVCNHLSNADPPILAAGVSRRHIRFMAKVELFRYPIGVVPRLWGAFPVRRFEADLGAMLNAERLLRRGEVLGMFPEGTRSRTGTLGQPHPGTALIALRSGAPVLPCALTGTERLLRPWGLLRRPRITIRIGEPLAIEAVRRPTEQQVSELTDRIFREIKALLPAEYGGAYTGQKKELNLDGANSPRQ